MPQCVLFSHSSSKHRCHLCHLALALFLLSCLRSWTTVPFQHDSLLFSPFPLFMCFCTLPLYTTCTASSDAFPNPSSNACSCFHADLHWCTRVNFHLRCRMLRDLVCDDVLQRDEQFSTWQCVPTDTIVLQTQASFFSLSRSSPRVEFSQNLPSFLFVSLTTFLMMSSSCSTSFARSRSLMLLIGAA